MGKFLALVVVLAIAGMAVYFMTQQQRPKAAANSPAAASGAPAVKGTIDAAQDPEFLEKFRGNVVLVDFWATWCGPCKMAMPGVQKLHERFEGRPVTILGVDCFEHGGDPEGYMKSKGYTYGLVVNGDSLAKQFNVSGIPTFVLFDPDGKAIMQSTGYDPSNEQKIGDAIESALKAKGL